VLHIWHLVHVFLRRLIEQIAVSKQNIQTTIPELASHFPNTGHLSQAVPSSRITHAPNQNPLVLVGREAYTKAVSRKAGWPLEEPLQLLPHLQNNVWS